MNAAVVAQIRLLLLVQLFSKFQLSVGIHQLLESQQTYCRIFRVEFSVIPKRRQNYFCSCSGYNLIETTIIRFRDESKLSKYLEAPFINISDGRAILQFIALTSGTCWSAMVRNGRCTELLNESSTKEDCCDNRNLATAWSAEELDSGTLFFWRVLGGGVPCLPCKESCNGVACSNGKVCVLKNGRPKCICSPKCRNNKPQIRGPVCGTDGRSYRSLCRLRKRACRRKTGTLSIAYYGSCQNSCDKITCPSGKHCLVDQNMRPHCVRCTRKCPASPSRRQVCGSDGITYPSACHLRETACRKGKAIPVAYKGKCKPLATCSKVRCRDQQFCLNDFKSGLPRCVTCTRRCPKPRHMPGPICGTNNKTYHSWCYMIQDACAKGYIIETKYSGKCGNSTET